MTTSILGQLTAGKENFDAVTFLDRCISQNDAAIFRTESGENDIDAEECVYVLNSILKELSSTATQSHHNELANLETAIAENNAKTHEDLANLLLKSQLASSALHQLEKCMQTSSAHISYLAGHLENIEIPRRRLIEAQHVIKYFDCFMSENLLVEVDIFDERERILEAAELIRTLHSLAQELPSKIFETAQLRISGKFSGIDQALVGDFCVAHEEGDVERMRVIADTLLRFPGYQDCIDYFLADQEKSVSSNQNDLNLIAPAFRKVHEMAQQIFPTSLDDIVKRFAVIVYSGSVQDYICDEISKNDAPKRMHQLHVEVAAVARKVQAEFSCFSSNKKVLPDLTQRAFSVVTEKYVNKECEALTEKCGEILKEFYGAKDELANNESFLSEVVMITLIDEFRQAYVRCKVLSEPKQVAINSAKLCDFLVLFVCSEYLEKSIDMALKRLQANAKKNNPNPSFLETVGDANKTFHLLEKLYFECVFLLVMSTPQQAECSEKLKVAKEQIEKKLATGITNLLAAIIQYVKHTLTVSQNKLDFLPDQPSLSCSNACVKVVAFVKICLARISECLDGGNLISVKSELGIEFVRVLYFHIQKFQYNADGGLLLVADVTEYEKCAKLFQVNLVTELFDILRALANLLILQPKNVLSMCSSNRFSHIDTDIVRAFLKLRLDYFNAGLQNVV